MDTLTNGEIGCLKTFYEFFAGGGMVRAALEDWTCLFANDNDKQKTSSYHRNWGSEELAVCDVQDLRVTDLPGDPDLVWASFPCQNLSAAGKKSGLGSSPFWAFWALMCEVSPPLVILENVCGLLSSNGGEDFNAIAKALTSEGYNFGALIIDAAHSVPQSRSRVFIVATRYNVPEGELDLWWHPKTVMRAYNKLEDPSPWVWWSLPHPPRRTLELKDIVDDTPFQEAGHLTHQMSDKNLKKLQDVMDLGKPTYGSLVKRTRGSKCCCEIRFDLANCVLAASRQWLIYVEGPTLKARHMSPREAARLMGLPDSYILPDKVGEAQRLVGDGVVVPVVKYLVEKIDDNLHL